MSLLDALNEPQRQAVMRSEERRVGKECFNLKNNHNNFVRIGY